MLVALHGCTQTAADFAAGTGFDELAERYGAHVLYPEQSPLRNAQRCWNWFLRENQSRSRGEPAAILKLVEEVCGTHAIDRERIFVAGLSAGAAMAAILAEQAPDIFAAAGMMAGVPLHASHDVKSAYALMQGEVEEKSLAPALVRKVALEPLLRAAARLDLDRRGRPSRRAEQCPGPDAPVLAAAAPERRSGDSGRARRRGGFALARRPRCRARRTMARAGDGSCVERREAFAVRTRIRADRTRARRCSNSF